MDGGSKTTQVGIYFSDFFGLDPSAVEDYGAFNVSLVNDLPLFIDPFLLFDSKDEKYQDLHGQIIKYLRFLRDQAVDGNLDQANINQWYFFKEVKQNWLGFSRNGNGGNGLGKEFATQLHRNLHLVFKDFGKERITQGSHLEKVCLFAEGVGRDHLSDFTTNLIKKYLLEYTQEFALKHLKPHQTRRVAVPKVFFDYTKKRWVQETFVLPFARGDYVILTPRDMLTRDAAWINRQDMLRDIEDICESIPDDQLRAQINSYFASKLGEEPSESDRREAATSTVARFPELIDYYIRDKEVNAAEAHKQSTIKVADTELQFIDQVKAFVRDYLEGTDFYRKGTTYEESMARVEYLKHVIEDGDGWRLFYVKGKPVTQESQLQLLYRLTWHATLLDVNREPNNGRGPVDYAISNGSQDKTLVEFKLARNTKLKSNLQNQVEVYERANNTQQSITVILHFDEAEYLRVRKILQELELTNDKSIVLIDGSPKQSASVI